MESLDIIGLVQLRLSALEYEQGLMAKNVAGVGGESQKVDFEDFFSDLQSLSNSQKNRVISEAQKDFNTLAEKNTYMAEPLSLDEEVARSLILSGKYKSLAEGINRKIDLLTTAIGGRS